MRAKFGPTFFIDVATGIYGGEGDSNVASAPSRSGLPDDRQLEVTPSPTVNYEDSDGGSVNATLITWSLKSGMSP